ncbi:MAG: 2-dehydro-3-deoxygalactonokinase [Burkholderiaceae bacterium]
MSHSSTSQSDGSAPSQTAREDGRTAQREATLIAIDWGTSSLRGARLDAQGEVLEERSFTRGLLTVAPGGFQHVFDECFGDWTRRGAPTCLISGMAGSKQGWREAPYCPCPAGFQDLAAHLLWLDLGPDRSRAAIVPGLSCEHTQSSSGLPDVPDVIRGEEVQILGAMQLTGLRDGSFVLPGTHSKWAQVENGRVLGFRTYLSGEVFALLSQQSILARTVDATAPFDPDAFALGVQRARTPGGLLHHVFGARTLSLFSRMEPGALANYLSGLVIGDELAAQRLDPALPVILIGSSELTKRYAQALALHAVHATTLDARATWAGLMALSQALPRRTP